MSTEVLSVKKEPKRVAWIDYMSGIGTLMVFMQHSCVPVVTRLILGFHMPLFFWISGFLYQQNGSYDKSFGSYIRSRAKRLMVPYLIWFAIDKCQAFFMRGMEQPLVFGQEVFHSFIYCTSWFLPCLFLSEIAFHFISRKLVRQGSIKWVSLSAFAVFFWILSGVENAIAPARAPFCIDTCLMALGFMFSGAASVRLIKNMKEQKFCVSILESGGLAGIGLLCVVLNGKNDANFMMYQNQYGNYLYAILGALTLIFALYFAVRALEQYLPKRYLLYLRDNGILLFLIHISIISMTKQLFPILNTVSPWISAAVCLCAIHIIGIPVCYMVNKWAPILAGKRK